MPDDPRGDLPRTPESTGLVRHIDVLFEDPALWPLLFIFVVHAVLAGALVLLWALRPASLAGSVALAILGMLSVHAVVRARRRRRTLIWIATLWTLSALSAGTSAYLGLL